MLALQLGEGAELRALEPWHAAEFAGHVAEVRDHLRPWIPFATRVVDETSARELLQRYADKQARDEARDILEKAGVQPPASESKQPPAPPKAGEEKKAPGEEKPTKDPPKDASAAKETKKGPDTPEKGEAKDELANAQERADSKADEVADLERKTN